MQYESAENKWANVGEQQSMIKTVRLFVKFSELRKIFNSWSIVFFSWEVWTCKIFTIEFGHRQIECSDLENFSQVWA